MTLYKDWFAQYSALVRCHRVWVIQINAYHTRGSIKLLS